MSFSEARSIWSTIDARGCGIVLEVYIGPLAGTGWTRLVERAAGASGAEGGNPRLVRQAVAHDRAQSLANGLVAIELGQAAEQQQLVDREHAPPAIEVQVGEQQVDVVVGRRDTDREVAGVDRGGRPARPT